MIAVPVEGKGESAAGKPQVLGQKNFGGCDVLPDGREWKRIAPGDSEIRPTSALQADN